MFGNKKEEPDRHRIIPPNARFDDIEKRVEALEKVESNKADLLEIETFVSETIATNLLLIREDIENGISPVRSILKRKNADS